MVDSSNLYYTNLPPRSSSNTSAQSFSSSLLDAIYRSIDDTNSVSVSMRDNHIHNISASHNTTTTTTDCKVNKKKSRKSRHNLTSTSSDSTCFSDSVNRPFPKDTVLIGKSFEDNKPTATGGFLKTKSRALKLYTDLKKVKQPISPGGKLAGFLNALFTGKPNKSRDSPPSMQSASTCSSASSFSRSCLSKTPSSRGATKSSATKRSVRFSPISVILADDRDNFQHKSFRHSSDFQPPTNVKLKEHPKEKGRRPPEEVARELVINYHRKNQFDYQIDQLRKPQTQNRAFEFEEYDEDDAASCASSDLFELENLSAIGMEELPVYETTNLGTNRAIANGLILY